MNERLIIRPLIIFILFSGILLFFMLRFLLWQDIGYRSDYCKDLHGNESTWGFHSGTNGCKFIDYENDTIEIDYFTDEEYYNWLESEGCDHKGIEFWDLKKWNKERCFLEDEKSNN